MIIKKLALAIIASSFIAPVFAHEAFVSAGGATEFKNKPVLVKSYHKITLTNNLNVEMTYQYTFRLCIEGWNAPCKIESNSVSVLPHTTKAIESTLWVRYSFNLPSTYYTDASTVIIGDGAKGVSAK